MLNNNILECIGNTPLIKINKIFEEFNSNFYCKCEFMNPSGSINDRIALKNLSKILLNYKDDIQFRISDQDMAISYSLITSNYNIPITLHTNNYVPFEKTLYLESLGSNILAPTFRKNIITNDTTKKIVNLDNTYNNIKTKLKDIFYEIIDQFGNKNIDFIFINNSIDGIVAAIGEKFKLINPNIKIIGVQSYINDIPCVSDRGVADSWIKVSNSELSEMLKKAVRKEGLLIGKKSALTLAGAFNYMKQLETKNYKNNNCIIILPDSINFSLDSLLS